ncbi:methyltransferase domain-containing protein [bacterium]|nr:methyltransferase domain-containing protein [bacterium]
MPEPDLTAALALTGPDATLKLYREWAASYDSGFARDMEYNLPAHVARAFLAAGGTGPVLDVGAGTGLVAQRLRDLGCEGPIDGLDFSAEMLAVAATKAVYRTLTLADVTRPLPLERVYMGITSSGTFTAGHVGPEAFDPMLAVALPGALFALSINRRVWQAKGFDKALPDLVEAGRVTGLRLIEVDVYGNAAARLDPEHAEDRALIALFRAA